MRVGVLTPTSDFAKGIATCTPSEDGSIAKYLLSVNTFAYIFIKFFVVLLLTKDYLFESVVLELWIIVLFSWKEIDTMAPKPQFLLYENDDIERVPTFEKKGTLPFHVCKFW
jgi:hypothetical protein